MAFYFFMERSAALEKDNRLEKVITGKMNKDIILLGSSRGARDIIASQIEDSLQLSTYNLSYPGSDIEFHEFLLKSVLKFNKAPKVVVLAVDYDAELRPSESIKFRLDRMYPLVKYDYIYNEMRERGELNFLSNYMVLSRINKSNLTLFKMKFNSLDSILDCGSMPISFQKKGYKFNYATISDYKVKGELPLKINSFLGVQELCKKYGCKLIIVFPPNFRSHSSLFEKRLKEISSPDVRFFVYDTLNNDFKNKNFFFDGNHLKKNGAIVFTNEIIEALKNEMDTLK